MVKTSRNKLRLHRKKRIKAKIKIAFDKPRLAVFRSLKGMSVQVIDDTKRNTLVSANLKEIKADNNLKGAEALGKAIAKKCLKKKISEVIFDRSGYKYHGKIKAIAEGARKEGLKF